MQLDLETIVRIRDRITELGLTEDAVDYVFQDYDHPDYSDKSEEEQKQLHRIHLLAGTMASMGGTWNLTLPDLDYDDLPEDFKVAVIFQVSGHFSAWNDQDELTILAMNLPAAWEDLQASYKRKRRSEAIIREALNRRARLQ